MRNMVKENVQRSQLRQARYYNALRKQEEFKEGELVWVRAHPISRADAGLSAKLAAKWKGPARIVRQINKVN